MKELEDEFKLAMDNGYLLARAIHQPISLARNANTGITYNYTNAEREIVKLKRKKGTPTPKKPQGPLTDGNPNRSLSLLGYGGGVLAHIGLLVFANEVDVMGCSIIDCDTKFGNNLRELTHTETTTTLMTILNSLKQGKNIRYYPPRISSNPLTDFYANHTEIRIKKLCTENIKGIYFCNEPCLEDWRTATSKGLGKNEGYISIINAIFLQKMFKRLSGLNLPILYYSYKKNEIKILNIDKESLYNLWDQQIQFEIKKQIANIVKNKEDNNTPLEDIFKIQLLEYESDDEYEIRNKIKLAEVFIARYSKKYTQSATFFKKDLNLDVNTNFSIKETLLKCNL